MYLSHLPFSLCKSTSFSLGITNLTKQLFTLLECPWLPSPTDDDDALPWADSEPADPIEPGVPLPYAPAEVAPICKGCSRIESFLLNSYCWSEEDSKRIEWGFLTLSSRVNLIKLELFEVPPIIVEKNPVLPTFQSCKVLSTAE